MTEAGDARRQIASRQDGRFAGKVVSVTWATSGIGRATALAFAREGASIVVADVAADGNRETARLIEQAGGQALAVACDVARGDQIKAALDAAVARFGRLSGTAGAIVNTSSGAGSRASRDKPPTPQPSTASSA
jgi:hypothetical protein